MNETNQGREKVLDKIKKLLALSTSANEHEAALATEKAQALLAEHNLTEEDVIGAANIVFTIDKGLITKSYPWKRQVATMVARLYFCTYYFQSYHAARTRKSVIRMDRHTFIGEPHNVMVAKMIFSYLTTTVERLAKEAAAKEPARGRDSFRRSFQWGCGQRLCHRIHDRIEAARKGGEVKTEKGTTLPALASMYDRVKDQLDQYLEDQEIKTKITKDRGKSNDLRGHLEGKKAADTIGLDTQVADHAVGNRLEHQK